ncbi:MAG: DUF1289 domain-containing protein [Polaromonas sp.]|nr:MAG: DUF1289 domain-containing protein [Polaromonas sp.]
MCGSELMALPEGVQKVAAWLEAGGHPHAPVMLDDAARTAQQAADALGVELGQIAKSIVFRRKSDDVAVLVVTSGDRRVDERKLEALVCLDGKRIGRADAAFVKARTGFSIGGVAPVAHAGDVLTLIDRSLMRFDEVWAAAGHPHAVFKMMPQALELLTGAPVVDVAVDANEENAARQNAIDLIAARARQISCSSENLPSPCISVCRISTDSGLCEGCFRTLGEISAWSRLPVEGKRELWQTIEQRIAALQP